VNGFVKLWLVVLNLWLTGAGVALALDHYVVGGLSLGAFMGLLSWAVYRQKEEDSTWD